MSRSAAFTSETIRMAKEILGTCQVPREAMKALSALVPAVTGATIAQTASIFGIGTATVARFQHEIRNQNARTRIKKQWGGRRRQILSMEEEGEFLAPWSEQAKSGGVLTVPPLLKALEEKVGHKVAPSTMYRMLGRHGWRKIEPETHHPKMDINAQEAFKKTSAAFSAAWRPARKTCR